MYIYTIKQNLYIKKSTECTRYVQRKYNFLNIQLFNYSLPKNFPIKKSFITRTHHLSENIFQHY